MCSELDQDFDFCDECQKCGKQVEQAGAPLCDWCDPETRAIYWPTTAPDIDVNIPFETLTQ